MNRIKVLYFIPNLAMGGPERQLLRLIASLPERYEPILCLYHDKVFFDRDLPPGQPKYVLGTETMDWATLDRLTEIMKQERPQIVHSYRDKANFWARLAALRAGVPVIVSSCRNRMMKPQHLLAERFLSDRSAAVLTNSEGVRQELVRWARVDPDKIRIIYNILEPDIFRPPSEAERAEARARWDLAPDQIALLLPGRIGFQKHQIGLLLAVDRLVKAGRWPANAQVLFAGRRRDMMVAGLVGFLLRRPTLRPYTRFLDQQKDIRSLYWASDILVMPSLYEGLSNAALEGCACGLPAILSHAVNIDGIVIDGETGIEVPTGFVGPLADALERMLRLSDDDRRRMGARGREHVIERFAPSPTATLDKTVAIYEELLARAGIGQEG